MARNGSGTYNLPAGNPVVTGTTISSTTTNNTFNDIATALTGSLSADGQTTPTGNLPMGGFAHTGVADATVRAQYGTAGQIQDSAFTYLTSASGTNAMTATASLGMSAYVTGQRFFFVAPSTNTGACTLNINSIGVKSVTKQGTTALVAGEIVSGAVIQVVYDGTQFQLLNPVASANVSSFSAGSTGLTPSTATTGAVTLAGTLAVANGGTGLATLTANNVMLGNGTSTPSFVAPSTTGNVLTSNGTTWTSSAPVTGGLTLLGTITTTSGTTVTLSSLTLTGYKQLQCVFNAVINSATSSTGYFTLNSNQICTATNYDAATPGSSYLTIDLTTGYFTSFVGKKTTTTGLGVFVNTSALTTSSTSISFTAAGTSPAFNGGSILVYGVK